MSERSVRRQHQREQARRERRRRRAIAVAPLAAAAALLAPAAAEAGTFEVNEKTDSLSNADCDDGTCTLRDAFAEAAGTAGVADTITFASTVTGEIRLTQDDMLFTGGAADGLTIDGPGASTLAISGDADGNGEVTLPSGTVVGDSRIFRFAGTAPENRLPVTIEGLTLRDGVASGYYDGPYDTRYEPEDGGAIRSRRTNLTITDSVISNSYASQQGGAIYADQLTMSGSTITGNHGRGGGGGILIRGQGYYNGSGPSVITDSTISGNLAGGEFTEGNAPFKSIGFITGGGLSIQGFGTSSVTDTEITGNTAVGHYAYTGGYVYESGESGGAAFRAVQSGAVISGLTVTGNESALSAGGLGVTGDVNVTGSLFTDNVAGRNSGGVSIAEGATLSNSTVSGNEAEGTGGGVRLRDDSALIGSTVSGNTAGEEGGGVFAAGRYNDPSTIDSSTIAGNTAGGQGGGVFSDAAVSPASPAAAPLILTNSAVGDNASAGGFDVAGGLPSPGPTETHLVAASFSGIEKAEASVSGNPGSSNKTGVDLRLGALANNGGPRQTILPAANSPLVDAANSSLVTDARGLTRPIDDPAVANASGGNASDIGAVERQTGDPSGIDTTPPQTTIVSKPPASGGSAPFTFTFSSSEAGSTFECSLDGAAFAACTSPKTFATLGAGSHTFRVRAKDGAGNIDGSPASHTFTVAGTQPPPTEDKTAPTTELTKAPSGKVTSKKKRAKLTFEFTGADAVTPAAGLDFECAVDGAAFKACSSPLVLKMKKGPHQFAVRAVDAAGNRDATPAETAFKVKVKKKKKGGK